MKRSGAPGLIGLLIVLVALLWLAARNWQTAAPEMPGGNLARPEQLREGTPQLPGLGEMERSTEGRAEEFRRALRETDG
jgi:hypothetical protein